MSVLSEPRSRRHRWHGWALAVAASLLLWAFVIWSVWLIATWAAQWL